jgi:hypothetical protein
MTEDGDEAGNCSGTEETESEKISSLVFFICGQ